MALTREHENINEALGDDINRWMSEPDVTDVILNPPLPDEEHGRIWVSRIGHPRKPVGFMPAGQALRLIGMVATTMRRAVTADTPMIEGVLITDGSRFTGCIPPNVAAPFFALRKRAVQVFSLSDYIERGQMTERQRALIEDAVRARMNIIVCGATGSGKTTLLNGVIDAMTQIHPHHRFFGIEEVAELQCSAPDRTMTLTSETVSVRALVKLAMRSFADRILIGEARGAEMLDILMAWRTGHEGGAATVHSNIATPVDALERIEDMLLMANVPPMPRMIGKTVDLVICMQRNEHTSERQVSQIVRVHGHDGHSYQLTNEV